MQVGAELWFFFVGFAVNVGLGSARAFARAGACTGVGGLDAVKNGDLQFFALGCDHTNGTGLDPGQLAATRQDIANFVKANFAFALKLNHDAGVVTLLDHPADVPVGLGQRLGQHFGGLLCIEFPNLAEWFASWVWAVCALHVGQVVLPWWVCNLNGLKARWISGRSVGIDKNGSWRCLCLVVTPCSGQQSATQDQHHGRPFVFAVWIHGWPPCFVDPFGRSWPMALLSMP